LVLLESDKEKIFESQMTLVQTSVKEYFEVIDPTTNNFQDNFDTIAKRARNSINRGN